MQPQNLPKDVTPLQTQNNPAPKSFPEQFAQEHPLPPPVPPAPMPQPGIHNQQPQLPPIPANVPAYAELQKLYKSSWGIKELSLVLVIIGAGLGLLGSFLPCATISLNAPSVLGSASNNAWAYWPGVFAGIAFFISLVFTIARLIRPKMSWEKLADDEAHISLGIISIIASVVYLATNYNASYTVIYTTSGSVGSRVITLTGTGFQLNNIATSITPSFGYFLMIIGASTLIVGAFMKRQIQN
jgi:hypothetical protein